MGAGASGLLAAGRAASLGAEVILLEKMKYPGMKLRITGKGQCNLTNVADLDTFLEQFGRNGRFLRSAFSGFFTPELMEFFNVLGVPLETRRGGRVFPASGSAPEVVRAIVDWCRGQGAEIRVSTPVESLVMDGGRVAGIRSIQGEEIRSDAVILAMGGASYPATGSNGDGFRLAASAGHSLADIRPALVPLEIQQFDCRQASGLQLLNVRVSMFVNRRKKREEFGELLFMDFGVSGPTVLRLSGEVADELREGNRVELAIDLKPGLDIRKLEARLLRDLDLRGTEAVSSILRGLLPRELVTLCLQLNGIAPNIKGNQLKSDARRRLRVWLKDWRFEVAGVRPLAEAIITAGGVSLKEVDPLTMGSRVVKGLFITGEMLDLQANTGGYNLQAAFSTGWVAGEAAAGQP